MTPSPAAPQAAFFGPWAVRAAFVLAMFGWGTGFYGPPIFLHAVMARTGWSLDFVSFAVTLHFLAGVLVVANLPRLHRRFGIARSTVAGAFVTAIGLLGWATANAPWQLIAAALLSGAGWVFMSAVTVNAIVATWYVRARPMALAKAYNGASIGGVIFSPLWVALIALLGFAMASFAVSLAMLVAVALLARWVFAKSPAMLGQQADGDAPGTPARSLTAAWAVALPGRKLWRDRRFLTLAAGMAAGLFAQIGLIAHLFSLLVPAMGEQLAGLTMGMATACAIGGRAVVGWAMPPQADRRLVACAAYAIQLVGTCLLLAADESQTLLILLGVVLFGSGIGNATSLPPLVAQVEFVKEDVARVVALTVATSQATYAFAPLVFGLLLTLPGGGEARFGHGTTTFFIAVALVQAAAMGCFLAGRRSA